jgi:hexosaminidase
MKMPIFFLWFGLAALLAPLAFDAPASPATPASVKQLHLMPVPTTLTLAEGKFRIDEQFHATLTGYSEPRLTGAQERFLQRLQQRTGIHFISHLPARAESAALIIHCAGPGEAVPSIRADESYQLEIGPAQARLSAPTPIGILHGLESLLQLADTDSESFYWPALTIEDRPRFPWRGLLIDVSRHWQPVEVIKRNLDAMATVKLNVLHWHLSDDQGFRVESRRFPKLQGMGSDGLFYTQAQLREIVAYARERGIRVVPEFDVPGHTTAWFPGYPMLASAPGPFPIERKWGVFDPVMDPSKEQVYEFLDTFIGELAPLFPDQYWHIGGDEVNGKQWNASSAIAAFKKRHNLKNNEELHTYFNKRLVAILTKHGKKAVGWDEILSPELPKSAVIQSWRGQNYLAQSAQKGYSGILSANYYLDHLRSTAFHYQVDPFGQQAASLTEDQRAMILGGEACMWGEYMTHENIDSRIWPRAAAVAERLWSPAEVKDIDDMYRRLARVSFDLELAGSTHNRVYPFMLQRMAGGTMPESLRTLGDIVESVKTLGRSRLRNYTSHTAMNRLTDAVPPESDLARDFNRRIDLALASQPGLLTQSAELRFWLTKWRDNHAQLLPELQEPHLLRELVPLSENVSALAAAGLQALEYLEFDRKPADAWTRNQEAFLKRIDKPEAECLIAILPGVRKLIAAANQVQ